MASTTEPRLPLTRDRILQAALELADAHGIESLSMRRLAQTLGFEAMSLYNHVANKDDLLDGVLDLVLAEVEQAPAGAAWDEAIRSSAISIHAAFRRHQWASPLLMSAAHIRPARLRQMDSLLELLRGAGFSADETYHAYHVLDGYITGFSLWESGHSFSPGELTDLASMVDTLLPVDRYPALHEHGKQHLAEGPHQGVSAFEFGLDLILEGLRETRRS
jgi:AcrR family transcriptional regulator